MNAQNNNTKLLSKSNECGKKFQCSQCYEYFRFRRHYDKHLEGHKQNNCKYCGKLFTVRKQLVIHLHEEHEIKLQDFKYNCQFCDRRFVKKLSLYQHYQLVHAEGKKVCLHCGGMFSEMSEFLKHQEKHKYAKPWKCDKCDEKFTRRQQYEIHIQAHEKYKCLTCMKSFSAQSKLVEHKKKGHEIKEFEAKHVCEKCERSFHLRRALVLHQRVHQGAKSLDAAKSNKNLSTKISHSKYLSNAVHGGSEDKVKAKQNKDGVLIHESCGNTHKEKHALGPHVARTHNKEEPKKCIYCDYKSPCKANLKRHMEFHTQDRKFICECCGASFHMLCTLKEHYLYIHSEERNFPCPKCDKSFKRKCGLNRHLRDHSENRPHICHCGQSYKRMSHLKRHKESSHGLVSQPSKLRRLRCNELGVLVPIEEESLPRSKKRTTSSSGCKKNKTKEGAAGKNTPNGEQSSSPQVCRFQEAKEVLLDTCHTETIIATNKEPLDEEMESEFTTSDGRTVKVKVNEGSATAQHLESSQVFSLQTADEALSKVENSSSVITNFSPDPQVSLNVGYILEGIPNSQGNPLQNLRVILGNQIISYPSCSQVVDFVQEPSECLPVVDLMQIVPPGNSIQEETTVLLCLSSVPTPVVAENLPPSAV